MNAPIDIVISIIERHMREAKEAEEAAPGGEEMEYYHGRGDACRDLIEEFEGFKKLFN